MSAAGVFLPEREPNLATDYDTTAIESELRRWPGVTANVTHRRSNHRKIELAYKGKKRAVFVGSTPSDHRATLNNISHIRKELRTLGAKPVEKLPVSRREEDMLMKAAPHEARMTITDKMVKVLVPTTSKLFNLFSTKGGKARSYWTIFLEAQPGPKADPLLVLEKRPDPEPGKKFAGITKGCFNEPARAFMLSIQGKSIEPMLKFGPFGVAPMKVKEQTDNRVVFYLPDDRPSIHPRKPRAAKEHPKEAPLPSRAWAERSEAPAPQPDATPPPAPAPAPQPEPEVARAEPIVIHPTINMPDKAMQLMMPKEPISLERAVNALNQIKNKYGEDIQFVVGAGGFLVVRAKLGGMPR